MYNFERYAVSPEATFEIRQSDYSITGKSIADITQIDFDSAENVRQVVDRAMTAPKESDELMYAAAAAIQRIESRREGAEEWADRMSVTFFADLENKSS